MQGDGKQSAMIHFNIEFETADALRLQGIGWEPEEKPKAVVCLLHGLGEHSGRYSHVAEAFARGGYATLAIDLRGHGRSPGQRGHAPNYALLMSDINGLLKEAKVRYPELPRFLYGHSLGGNLAIHYALKRKSELVGIIASAPLFRVAFKPPAWKSALLNTLHALHLNLPVSSGLEEEALCRDYHVVQRYQDDPLVHDHITPRLAVDMFRAGEWNLKRAARFPLPILLMHGEADRITSPEASVEFAAQLEHRCTLKIWDGLYHELHNEPEKEQVLNCMLEWLNARC